MKTFCTFTIASFKPYSLQNYPLSNKTGADCIEELTKRLLALGAVGAGQFLVDGDIFDNSKFFSNKLGHKILNFIVLAFNKTKIHVLHNSEYPASVFSIIDNGQKQIPLITDLIFDLLMLKVNPIYTSKKMIKVN